MSLKLPPIFILSTNLQPDELHSLEESVESLTWDATEAEVIVGKITRRERAQFELRKLKINTDEIQELASLQQRPSKRRKTTDSGGRAEHVNALEDGDERKAEAAGPGTVKVVKLEWLTNSIQEGVALPYQDYLLYQGRRKAPPRPLPNSPKLSPKAPSSSRARSHAQQARPGSSSSQRPTLLHETTSEHDISLPPVPDFLHTTYSCQRPTPVDTPNADFIEQLKEVRTLRLLQGDQIGVRAYSTSIAALAAYPHAVRSSFGKQYPKASPTSPSLTFFTEISRLPGCGAKIAQVWQQWKETGRLNEVTEAESNARLSVLKLFYDIWGVGDTTARDFYAKGASSPYLTMHRQKLRLTKIDRLARSG